MKPHISISPRPNGREENHRNSRVEKKSCRADARPCQGQTYDQMTNAAAVKGDRDSLLRGCGHGKVPKTESKQENNKTSGQYLNAKYGIHCQSTTVS